MEKKFYNEEFEQFLRESVENFQMFPSRKVWYGIYNDLHPSKKWPSLAITLLLVSAVLFLGISNNNAINRNTQKNTAIVLLPQNNTVNADQFNTNPVNKLTSKQQEVIEVEPTLFAEKNVLINPPLTTQKANPSTQNNNEVVQVIAKTELPENNEPVLVTTAEKSNDNIFIKEANAITKASIQNASLSDEEKNIEISQPETHTSISLNTVTASLPAQQPELKVISISEKKLQKEEERKWIENYAFYNKPAQKRWKARSLLSFYITPSLGFRTFESKPHTQPVNSSIAVNNNSVNRDIADYISQASAVNLEVGSMLIYNISKNLRIKGGLQFNYSNYLSFAELLSHTTQTTLLLKGDNGLIDEVPVTSMYKNNYSNPYALSRINNKSLQLSIPIGADYKIAGNKKLKLYTGATIQPTLITGANAYAISADKRYYAEYPSLLRKFNVNAAFESFLSYTTANGASIIVGPQVRYQLFSSFNNRYLYSEKRYNVGVKIGFTTSF